jgi:hypothetical protein
MLIDRNEIVPSMKKYIFTSSIILAFALVSNATIYVGGTGRSTVFLNGDDVVLKSGAGDKFSAGSLAGIAAAFGLEIAFEDCEKKYNINYLKFIKK